MWTATRYNKSLNECIKMQRYLHHHQFTVLLFSVVNVYSNSFQDFFLMLNYLQSSIWYNRMVVMKISERLIRSDDDDDEIPWCIFNVEVFVYFYSVTLTKNTGFLSFFMHMCQYYLGCLLDIDLNLTFLWIDLM